MDVAAGGGGSCGGADQRDYGAKGLSEAADFGGGFAEGRDDFAVFPREEAMDRAGEAEAGDGFGAGVEDGDAEAGGLEGDLFGFNGVALAADFS